jgi:hypothetical protein
MSAHANREWMGSQQQLVNHDTQTESIVILCAVNGSE